MSNRYSMEPLAAVHERAAFASGAESLDTYFRSHVTQDIRRRLTACFVAVEIATGHVVGYYTLASSSIPLPDLADAVRRKLPRYPLIPAVRLGRLAVDRAHRGGGLGGALLLNALVRAIRSEITAYAMVVDAKDDAAVAFYRHHGFASFESVAYTLYLPLAEASRRLAVT